LIPETPPYRRGGGFGSLGVRFSEVLEPAGVSLWPATAGAWITLGLLALLLAAGIAWLVVRYRQRRYRRLADRELQTLARSFAESGAPTALEALPAVLKRCALGSFPRERVAALSGEAWRGFLDSTCSRAPFAADAGRTLVTLTTRGADVVERADAEGLFAAAQIWVRRHRASL
jgi:hypothetical protein